MQKVQSRLNIIFTAFLFSSLVYLIVGFALTKSGWQPVFSGGNLDTILLGIFLAVSSMLIVIAIQLKNRLGSETPEKNAEAILSKSIFLFALSEVPAILGLVLFLLTGNLVYLMVLCAVSILSFVLVKPR